MKYKYIPLLPMILMASCLHNLNPESYYRFKELSSLMEPELTAHIEEVRNRFSSQFLSFPNTTKYNNGLQISCFMPYSKRNSKKALELFKGVAVPINLDCSIITSDLHEEKKYVKKKCTGSVYPIPNYYEWFSNPTKTPDDLTFYILESKGGHYLPDSLLTNGGGMPICLKNGFSKGIAITKKKNKIVYWVIAW